MNPEPGTTEHELEPRGRSAAERAYDYVKERLLDGRFAGGTLLSENELAQRLGLSRTPVRQAFVQLEGEELLELYPKRGALVVPISPSEASDVLEARLLIEQHCARRAAVVGGPALAAELAETIAAQEKALRTGIGFAWADRQFHRAIVSPPATSCSPASTTRCATAISGSPRPRSPATRRGSPASSPSTGSSRPRSSAVTPTARWRSPPRICTPRTSSPAAPRGGAP